MIAGLKLENGQYGRRGVVTSVWSDQITTYVKDHEISELELNHTKGWHGNDLMFLLELPHLVSLQILDLRISDVTPIHSLHALKTLSVMTYCTTEIDFRVFSALEDCSLEWRPNAQSLFECKTLEKLVVNRYDGKDITPFTNLTELKSLTILNAPIESLRGLERLQKLRRLRLADLRRISSLAGIETLNQLEELEIHTCRGFSSIEELRPLTNLRTLSLSNNGNIESFRALERLARLESLVFYESTNVLDGDLSPVWNLRKLSNVSFQDRPHYSHRREDFSNPREH
jgi:Leucine-rich repeat (LRR) protein